MLTGSLPARTRSFCAQQKQSAIVSRDKTVPIKHENSSQEEERCINCFVAERDCGKGETEQKSSPCFLFSNVYLIQMWYPKAHLQGANEYLPVEVLVRLELSHSGGFIASRGEGLIYAGLGSRYYYFRESARLGLGERQERVRDSQDTLRVGHELRCLQRKLGKVRWEKNPKKVG